MLRGDYGAQLLCQLATRLDVADEAGVAQRRGNLAAGAKGREHEGAVTQWVKATWPPPRYRVLPACSVVDLVRYLSLFLATYLSIHLSIYISVYL